MDAAVDGAPVPSACDGAAERCSTLIQLLAAAAAASGSFADGSPNRSWFAAVRTTLARSGARDSRTWVRHCRCRAAGDGVTATALTSILSTATLDCAELRVFQPQLCDGRQAKDASAAGAHHACGFSDHSHAMLVRRHVQLCYNSYAPSRLCCVTNVATCCFSHSQTHAGASLEPLVASCSSVMQPRIKRT